MTYKEKSSIVISQLRADRDRLQDALDKIRAEIDKIYEREGSSFDCLNALDDLKEFIDKLAAEGSGEE